MPKLMRGEATNAGPLTHAPDHSHQRLRACGLLRILALSNAVVLRDPFFDLNGENVVIEFWLE